MGFTLWPPPEPPRWPVHPHARGVYGYCSTNCLNISRSIPTHVGFTRSRTSGKESTPVHPHARGVYVFRLFRHQCISGPSPRTWGLLHAGEGHQGIRPVHPHARGVYGLYKLNSLFNYGPSPRTWGLLRQSAGVPAVLRSIPTHVGFTACPNRCTGDGSGPSPRTWGLRCSRWKWSCCQPVHPHARGVYPGRTRCSCFGSGPSPRTWGLHYTQWCCRELHRSIPTHVGFTDLHTANSPLVSVHPHARGVYVEHNASKIRHGGPSPRTWGLRPKNGVKTECTRSIPTHVGFTRKRCVPHNPPTVHPHARGVYYCIGGLIGSDTGPSPRTWGLRVSRLMWLFWIRSIPTHVGFTAIPQIIAEIGTVHPHARGVYELCHCRWSYTSGPSPRTWGLLGYLPFRASWLRSIPTHVGFTQA